ncbi:35240_t:CDS:2, partial [Racocetra persica]
NEYDLAVVTNVNKQMETYVNATTTRFTHLTNQLLECAKNSSPKRIAKVTGDDPNNSFAALETTNENNLNDLTASGLLDE